MWNSEAIDVHNHYVSPQVVRELREHGERYGVRVESDVGGNPVFVFPDRKTSPLIAALTDLRERLAHMARVGISRAVLSTWIELQGHGLGEERARLLSRLINSELAKVVKQNAGRFLGVANLPLPYGRAAAEELEAALEEGLSGAMVPTSVLGVDLDSDFMEPVWAKAEELDAPIILHPATLRIDGRLNDYYFQNLLGNPMDTTIAASRLIFSGVLERHPRLKIVLVHGGGYLPYALGRLEHGHRVRAEAKAKIGVPPSAYTKRFYYDTVVYDERALRFLIDLVGQGNVVLGTDYPFDMELPDAVAFVTRACKSGDEAKAILSENAKRLFELAKAHAG